MKIADTLSSPIVYCLTTVSRNLVEILIKDSAFCLNQTSNVYLCPTQCIDRSLMRVIMSLGHKILYLSLGMCYSNKHKIMPKWGIFNVSVLLNEHGHPLFYFKIKVLV